jgi:DNA-binding transcriptional LysR family regulator
MNFLAQKSFDLYELALFQLVAKHRSFTRAASAAGLTQSALTRQVQGMERALGVELLKRTTRMLAPTAAGEFLLRESARLIGDVESVLRRLREEYANAPKEIRVDVSRSIGLAYLPGFFHANLKKLEHVSYRVRSRASAEIVLGLEADELDVGVICPPRKLPPTVRVTHRFEDLFTGIAPAESARRFSELRTGRERREWVGAQRWLLFDGKTTTGGSLREWLSRNGYAISAAVELDSFDLIINLVALGMGASFVPVRTLALYPNKRGVARVKFPKAFSRELAVIIRKRESVPAHLAEFVRNVLF